MKKFLLILLVFINFFELKSPNKNLKKEVLVSLLKTNASDILTQMIEKKYQCSTVPSPLSIPNIAFALNGSTVVNDTTIKLSNKIGKQITQLTNQHRATKGRAPLSWDNLLARVGRQHTIAMANGTKPFSHAGFNKRFERYQKLLKEKHPNATVVGFAENLFYGSNIPTNQVARVAVNAWINSPGHEANLVGNYNRTGVAAFKNSQNVWYITQLFALVR